MKLKIPKVLKVIDLGDYAPELTGQIVQVWVNPPREVKRQYNDATAKHFADVSAIRRPTPEEIEQGVEDHSEADYQALKVALNRTQLAWWAHIFSQGNNAENHWTGEELEALDVQDPAFLGWLIVRADKLMQDHQQNQKKVYPLR